MIDAELAELAELTGAAPHEHPAEGAALRNGHRTRTLSTRPVNRCNTVEPVG